MTLHFARSWRIVHLWGLACPWLPGDWWAEYYVSVAVLEALALVLQAITDFGRLTWSGNVWAWLYDPLGRMIGWRVFAVALWSLYFGAAFIVVAPWFGPSVDPLIGLFFLVWVWAHFFHDRRARRKPHG